jgi:hypothetical protein
MHKKLYAFIFGSILLIAPVSTLLVDAPPAIATHHGKKTGKLRGPKKEKHQSGPQKGLGEKKRQNEEWQGRGMAGKKRTGNPARRHSGISKYRVKVSRPK